MKALVLPVAALLTLALAPKAHAQFGVKGGVNFAQLHGKEQARKICESEAEVLSR